MGSKKVKLIIGLGTVAAVVLTVAVILLAASQQFKVSCEVCMTFRGRSVCRTAQGATREEAMETAKNTACAYLAAGMTATQECMRQPATSVTFDE